MPHDSNASNVPAHLSSTGSALSLAPITLTGGLDREELDALVPGQLYVLTPIAAPARFPLWANLLRAAVAAGRICHVLVKTDPAEFLERLQVSGWSKAEDAWMNETLCLYRMSDTFSKILFRLDVEGLTTELGHWGIRQQHVLLVDAADELLSLHDLSLATPQAVKLKAWAKGEQVSVLLSFNQAASPTVKTGLTGLMDHFSGVARLRSEAEGAVLILEYWQSPTGSVAERGLALELIPEGYRLRSGSPSVRKTQRNTPSRTAKSARVGASAGDRSPVVRVPDCFTVDQVWARELQLLMGTPWRAVSSIKELNTLAAPSSSAVILLRFGPDSDLAEMAREVHGLRKTLGTRVRLIVAELKASLRYANELMLLRLGVDAIIKPDVPIERWPALLMNGHTSATPRLAPDIDVESAMASATSSHARGYLQVPDFLAEVHAALERGQVLGVPFALAVLRHNPRIGLIDAVKAAEFRRQGDIFATDGEKLYALFYACSITKGPAVLESAFRGHLSDFVSAAEWMVSDADIQQVLAELQSRYKAHPIDVIAAQTQAAAAATEMPDDDIASPVLTRLKVRDAVRVAPPEEAKNEDDASQAAHSPSHEAPATEQPAQQPVQKSSVRSLGDALMGMRRRLLSEHENLWPSKKIEKSTKVNPPTAPTASTAPTADANESHATQAPVQDLTAPSATASSAASLANTDAPSPPSHSVDDSLNNGHATPPPPPSAPTTDEAVDPSKKVRAYRVSEVGPFSPPQLGLSGISPQEVEKQQEDHSTAAPEVAGIIRRLAQPPTGGIKKTNRP